MSGREEAPLSLPPEGGEPFVETRAGGLFFLNAVLASPALVVLFPLVLRALLRSLGAVQGPSRILDPIPAVADYAGYWIAWLAVVPLWTTWRNLRMPLPGGARWALRGFLALHLGILAWWIERVLGPGA